jgi:hypothetical protein
MRTRQIGVVGVLLMAFCLVGRIVIAHSGGDALSLPSVKQPPESHPVATQLRSQPLQFEANHGQLDGQVKFLPRGKGDALFLRPTESVMVLTQQDANFPIDDRREEFIMTLTFVSTQPDAPTQVENRPALDPLLIMGPSLIPHSGVRMTLEETSPSPATRGLEQLPGIVNLFIGKGSAK